MTLTTAEQRAGWLLAGVLAACGLVYLVGDRRARRRRRNPAAAILRRRRVGLADGGRVISGVPDRYRGVHVLDLSPLSREVRQIEQQRQSEEKRIQRTARRRSFKGEEGIRGLLDANPNLVDFLEAECSHDCETYRAWVRGGRRGPKPRWRKGDGRFDAINERFERRTPGRKVASWIEAVFVTPPPSHQWKDFAERVPVLEEATGLQLNLPEPAEARELADQAVERVDRAADDRIEALLELARTSRLHKKPPAVEDAPF